MPTPSEVVVETGDVVQDKTYDKLIDIFSIEASTKTTKKELNVWLNEFELIIASSFLVGNSLISYSSVNGVKNVAGTSIALSAFKEAYNTRIQVLSSRQLVEATVIRNSVGSTLTKGAGQKLLKEFDDFAKGSYGKTLYQKKKEFLALSQSKGKLVFKKSYIKDGVKVTRQWDPDAYAKMLQRTQGAEISSIMTMQEMKDLDLDVVQISNARTKTPICLEYEGKFFSLKGLTPELPILPFPTPFHPNCVHVMLPQKDYKSSMLKANEKIDSNSKRSKIISEGQSTINKQTEYLNSRILL